MKSSIVQKRMIRCSTHTDAKILNDENPHFGIIRGPKAVDRPIVKAMAKMLKPKVHNTSAAQLDEPMYARFEPT
jgi:hypothetical protein